MSEVKTKIRNFLQSELEVEVESIADGEPLFTSGLIDSYSLIELLSFIETELEYNVNLAELSVDDFDTIDALAQLVQS